MTPTQSHTSPKHERRRQWLHGLSRAFREAIERADRSRLGITLVDFPSGSCGDAALLLGHFLKSKGACQITYVLGGRGHGGGRRSHAWLEVDGFIVDITADQLPDNDERVVVEAVSNWHETFDIVDDQREGDFVIYDAATVAHLAGIYAVIVAELCKPIPSY